MTATTLDLVADHPVRPCDDACRGALTVPSAPPQVARNSNGTFVSLPVLDRLLAHVVISPAAALMTPCWLSTYRRNAAGYTAISIGGSREFPTHRVAYELFVGPIPHGLMLDHLCRVRHCVNPLHLEPVTNLENIRRGINPTGAVLRTGLCQRGHSMEDAYPVAGGGRRCRICTRERSKRYKQERRASS